MIFYDLTQLPATSSVYRAHAFDGDTLRVSGTAFTGIIRIWGIDAPEHGQRWFIQSLERLIDLTRSTQLTLLPITWDRYNRLVARLLGHRDIDIGYAMIQEGHAWWENLHAPHADEYHEAQKQARRLHLGLWSQPPPHVPPWQFRRRPI
jgi:endonuclease YncB( thermonuclease family)